MSSGEEQNRMGPPRVLILSDDSEFARTVVARWQAERDVPDLTVVSSEVRRGVAVSGYKLVLLGPVRGDLEQILAELPPSVPLILSTDSDRALPSNGVSGPAGGWRGSADATRRPAKGRAGILVVPRRDAWVETLILLSKEIVKRADAESLAEQAHREAAKFQNHATLGRYALEMRSGVINALTSVLGNAELLLLEPGQFSGQSLEQMRTIHTMALRLSEMWQRFSSVANEIELAEKQSHAETEKEEATFAGGH